MDESDVTEYAKVIWVADDVKAIRPSWSMEKCEEELSNIERRLEEGMIMAGWQVLEGCLPGEE